MAEPVDDIFGDPFSPEPKDPENEDYPQLVEHNKRIHAFFSGKDSPHSHTKRALLVNPLRAFFGIFFQKGLNKKLRPEDSGDETDLFNALPKDKQEKVHEALKEKLAKDLESRKRRKLNEANPIEDGEVSPAKASRKIGDFFEKKNVPVPASLPASAVKT